MPRSSTTDSTIPAPLPRTPESLSPVQEKLVSQDTQVTRRDFVKSGIAATTALTVGIPITEAAAANAKGADAGIAWD